MKWYGVYFIEGTLLMYLFVDFLSGLIGVIGKPSIVALAVFVNLEDEDREECIDEALSRLELGTL